MTMSMYSSYSPEDFRQDDSDIFGEMIQNFLTTISNSSTQTFSQSSVRILLDCTPSWSCRLGLQKMALPSIHIIAWWLVGKCNFPERSKRNFCWTEEESSIPIHFIDRHALLSASTWLGSHSWQRTEKWSRRWLWYFRSPTIQNNSCCWSRWHKEWCNALLVSWKIAVSFIEQNQYSLVDRCLLLTI